MSLARCKKGGVAQSSVDPPHGGISYDAIIADTDSDTTDWVFELRGQREMVVKTDYPATHTTVACTGENQAVAARTKPDHVDFIVPGIMMLVMGSALTGELTVSKDGKSFIVKRCRRTYTYTPSRCDPST